MAFTKKELDDRSWSITTTTIEKLRGLAREAREAAKAPGLSLSEKLELQNLAKKAEEGQRAVADIFAIQI